MWHYVHDCDIMSFDDMISIIKSNDITYSPLALYYLLDNNLLKDNDEINDTIHQIYVA